ncbi:hypothetical protein [Caulobacter sp. LARHSG274]
MTAIIRDELVEAAARAVVRGSLLFHLDLAQALALDALPPGLEVGGWAVDLGAAGYEVTFLDADLARELYAVTFAADGSPLGERRRGRTSPRLTALAAARRATLAWVFPADDGCIVAPPPATAPSGQPLEAYVLRRGEASWGEPPEDHRRITLSPDGRRVLSAELVVSRAVPSEAYVYLSLKRGVALELTTPDNGARWRVDGESISRL